MIYKHILLITILNDPEVFFLQTVKWLQILISNMNNSNNFELFVYTKLNGFKHFYLTVTI